MDPRRKLLSCRRQCGRILTDRTKGKRGSLPLAAGHHAQREQATKNALPSACLPLGNGGGRTEGANTANSRLLLPSWVAFQTTVGPFLCCRWCQDHSYCARHYQEPRTACSGSLIFCTRAWGHCNLGFSFQVTCNPDPTAWADICPAVT